MEDKLPFLSLFSAHGQNHMELNIPLIVQSDINQTSPMLPLTWWTHLLQMKFGFVLKGRNKPLIIHSAALPYIATEAWLYQWWKWERWLHHLSPSPFTTVDTAVGWTLLSSTHGHHFCYSLLIIYDFWKQKMPLVFFMSMEQIWIEMYYVLTEHVCPLTVIITCFAAYKHTHYLTTHVNSKMFSL